MLRVRLGGVCSASKRRALVTRPRIKIHCCEIQSFRPAYVKNVPAEHEGRVSAGAGLVLEPPSVPETKLVRALLVGDRSAEYASHSMDALAHRLTRRIQLATDGQLSHFSVVQSRGQASGPQGGGVAGQCAVPAALGSLQLLEA
jgi:hypothetical protein